MYFAVNQEKRIHRILQKLVEPNVMVEETSTLSKHVGNRPDVIYDLKCISQG